MADAMMKTLLCHNSYKQPGGEDRVFQEEKQLLESHGHEVFTFTAHNDSVDGMSPLDVACRTVWNRHSYDALRARIRQIRPDVMHCTNVFPLISPSAYYAARAEGVPVVQSLHNYRMFCSNGFLFRDGKPCDRCVGARASWSGVVHACYRNDRAASAVVAAMQVAHHVAGTWRDAIDLYISCSEFARRTLVAGGMAADSIVVKPNFVCEDPGIGTGSPGKAVFVGRLSPEKGIDTLLEAWARMSDPVSLTVIGDGPLADRVRDAASHDARVRWLGWQEPSHVAATIGAASCLLMTSLWPEIFGRTVIEAFASGTPVVASRLGALTELVDDGRTGYLVAPGDADALVSAVRRLAGGGVDTIRMRTEARAEYERHYTAAGNHDQLLAVYERAIDRHRSRTWSGTFVPVATNVGASTRTSIASDAAPRRPRVSVGVPVYNGAEYLEQALDALLAQTFQDFEIIISDNASSDATASICRAYAALDPRVRYQRRETNIGAIANFNAVFQTARGEYFKWASHDDVCAPTFLERCVALLDADPSVEWCHTQSSHIDPAGRPLDLPGMANVSYAPPGPVHGGPSTTSTSVSRESDRASDRFRAVLLGEGGCLDSYGLIRVTAIHRTRLYLPYFGSEKVFIAELALLGRFREIPEVLFYPRVHPRAAASLPTAEAQVEYTNPAAPRAALRRRLGLLWGYAQVVRGARLPTTERLRCSLVILRYLLQAHKWRAVLKKALDGGSMADDVRQELFEATRSAETSAEHDGLTKPETSVSREAKSAHV